MTLGSATLVFLDANVLAKLVTRTLLMVGGVPTGDVAGRFAPTKGNDRQILADADAARARFLVTEDMGDFAEADLVSLGISAR